MSFASLEEMRPQCVRLPASEQLKRLFSEMRTFLQAAEQQLPLLTHLSKAERTHTYAKVKAANKIAERVQGVVKTLAEEERKRWKEELQREMMRVTRLGNAFYRVEQQLSDSSSEEGGEKDAFLSDQFQQQSDSFELQLHTDFIQDRDTKISHISSTIEQVNALFKEISTMVNEQGECLDLVEDHLDSAAAQTKRTVEELERAVDKGKDNRQRQCCLALLAVLLLLVVALLVLSWRVPQ